MAQVTFVRGTCGIVLTDSVSPVVNLGGEQKYANGCHVLGKGHKRVLLFTRASVLHVLLFTSRKLTF